MNKDIFKNKTNNNAIKIDYNNGKLPINNIKEEKQLISFLNILYIIYIYKCQFYLYVCVLSQ